MSTQLDCFSTPFGSCEHCKYCQLLDHEKLEIHFGFGDDMTAEEYIDTLIKFVVLREYSIDHIELENKQLESNSTRKFEELLAKAKQARMYGTDEVKNLQAQMKKVKTDYNMEVSMLKKLFNLLVRKYSKLCRNALKEMKTKNNWKKHIVADWDPKKLKDLLDKYPWLRNPTFCNFHGEDMSNCTKDLYSLYPKAEFDIMYLSYSGLELTDINTTNPELITFEKQDSVPRKNKLVHGLIKRSRYRFEYVVGVETEVNEKINGDDIVFMEPINKINDDHLKIIQRSLADMAKAERNNALVMKDSILIVKKHAVTPLKTILNIFKEVHV